MATTCITESVERLDCITVGVEPGGHLALASDFRFSPRLNEAHLIKWRDWNKRSFDEAKKESKPIQLPTNIFRSFSPARAATIGLLISSFYKRKPVDRH